MFENVKSEKVSSIHEFEDLVLKGTEYHGTIEFDNGYGLSIIRHSGSYGGRQGHFEILLTKNGTSHVLPPITIEEDSVKGFMVYDDVLETIQTVKELPGTV